MYTFKGAIIVALINIGPVKLAMKYLQYRSSRDKYYYRRLVPDDLQAHYPRPELFFSLKTSDKKLAVKLCDRFTRQYDGEFYRLRNGLSKDKVSNLHSKAIQRLKDFKIASTKPDEHMKDLFYDYLDEQITNNISGKEYEKWLEGYDLPDKALDPVDRAAFAIVKGEFRLKVSQYPEEYLRLNGWTDDKKKYNECHNAIRFITEFFPDQPPADYNRSDVVDLIRHHLDAGSKTRTVERKLKTIQAMLNRVNLDLELTDDKGHPFHHFRVPNLGEDSTDRLDLEPHEIKALRKITTLRKPEIPLIIKLLLDTGMRIGECCGLRTEDLKLHRPTPYIELHRNTFRRLKTKNSKRLIPLVGSSLDAAYQVVKIAENGWLFPNYVDLEK